MAVHRSASGTLLVTRRAAASQFRVDVLTGLSRTPKEIPSKYFYDARGSALFDRICELPEYYLTRTELAIMHYEGKAVPKNVPVAKTLLEKACKLGSAAACKNVELLKDAK